MKKLIEYHTPKRYKEKDPDYIDELGREYDYDTGHEFKIKKKPPKSKYCRKLKGKHVFGKWQPYFFGWEKDKSKPNGWFVRFCEGCNRKDTWMAPTLPGKYWKLDLTARPEGYEDE